MKFTPAGTKTTFAFGPLDPYALAFEPITEKLRNISARALVQGGENVLIAGLVVGGNALANNGVILRAIGPSLTNFGIVNPLRDPILELHNSTGAIIASNDNWAGRHKDRRSSQPASHRLMHVSLQFTRHCRPAHTPLLSAAPTTLLASLWSKPIASPNKRLVAGADGFA